MTDRRNYLRFLIWGAVLFVLMSTWLYVWEKKTEPEVEKTAFIIAQKQILNNANYYKKNWLIKKKPSVFYMDGRKISFTKYGWPIVLQDNDIQCEEWLLLLWPDKEVFAQSYILKKHGILEGNITCEYYFSGGNSLYLQLINKGFYAKVK